MGHADAKTMMRYLHHKIQVNEAELLVDAFRPSRCRLRAGQRPRMYSQAKRRVAWNATIALSR
jgi:hypothetical protein